MTDITFTSELTAELVDVLASDRAVVDAARVSTLGERVMDVPPKRTEGLIQFLMRNGHTSPFEHGMFKFFVHAPIFVAREFMRHRTFSFNEESGRYRQLQPVFYRPLGHRPLVQSGKVGDYNYDYGDAAMRDEVFSAITNNSRDAYGWYMQLLNAGIAKEVARMVLPVNIFTSFYATVDPHNLMHFLDLRTAPDATYEIRIVANQMEQYFKEHMPVTWEAWKDESRSNPV